MTSRLLLWSNFLMEPSTQQLGPLCNLCYRSGCRHRLAPRDASRDTPEEASEGMPRVKVHLLMFYCTTMLRMP